MQMISKFRHKTLRVVLAGIVLVTPACDDFVNVPNPNNLEAEAIDPDRDAAVLSRSAFQSFNSTYGDFIIYSAWFTNEARVGDTFPTRNEFGRRDIIESNTHTTNELWANMYRAIMFAEQTIDEIEGAGNTVDLARAYFTAGWGMLEIGMAFCEGTVPESTTVPRGPITSAQMLDSALVRLQKANEIGRGLSGGAAAEGTALANAALVGIARIHLQNGRRSEAASVAAQVPANFTFNLLHFDDANNRTRLGNRIWSFSESRISLVVGDEWRAMAAAGDPRIAFVDMGRVAQDGVLRFFRQNKITGWASPDRLASKLEADYIAVEARANPAEMLTFINQRRTVGRQASLAATTDLTVLLRELMDQKSRDFWLENKRLADFRRLGNAVPFILPPGNTYYKSGLGAVGNQTCFPVPGVEKRNNPNWPR